MLKQDFFLSTLFLVAFVSGYIAFFFPHVLRRRRSTPCAPKAYHTTHSLWPFSSAYLPPSAQDISEKLVSESNGKKITQSKLPATRLSRFLQYSWTRGPRAEAPERTPKAEVRRSPHGAQDSKRKEFLHQQEKRRRGLDLFGYFLGQAKKVTPGEGADSSFKNT
jgi:hypothetical protein